MNLSRPEWKWGWMSWNTCWRHLGGLRCRSSCLGSFAIPCWSWVFFWKKCFLNLVSNEWACHFRRMTRYWLFWLGEIRGNQRRAQQKMLPVTLSFSHWQLAAKMPPFIHNSTDQGQNSNSGDNGRQNECLVQRRRHFPFFPQVFKMDSTTSNAGNSGGSRLCISSPCHATSRFSNSLLSYQNANKDVTGRKFLSIC